MPKAITKKLATKKIVAKKKPIKIVKKAPVKKPKKTWLTVLGIANIVVFLAVIIINYLAVSLPIGGMTT